MERNLTNTFGRHIGLLIIVLAAVTWLPWLSLTLFNTKGEPREAIVAVSMLQSGNWILPVSMGADIPYKPPMLAWLISILSLPFGRVTEYTARMPSAIAAIILVWTTYRFYLRHDRRKEIAAVAALVLMTSIEVWRAGSACRVDMVLTAATVGAICSLYNWLMGGMRRLPVVSVLCMTVAVLTKGPVGFVLPALCVWLYNFLRPASGRRQLTLTLKLAAAVILSCLLPAVWYLLAARQGGDGFLALVYEENIGRATGTMSYASHENGAWYNLMTLAVGMLPYTLAMLFGAFLMSWKNAARVLKKSFAERNDSRRQMAFAFSVVSAIIIIAFYTIPKSKRSVYLLPMYPFVAYVVTLGLFRLAERSRKSIAMFTGILGCVSLLCGVLSLAGTILPESLIAKWPELATTLRSVVAVIMAMLAIWTGAGILRGEKGMSSQAIVKASVAGSLAAYWCLSAGILPGVLNSKSDRPAAEATKTVTLPDETVYQFINDDMLRFYTANFYLADRLRLFADGEMPSQGVLMVSEKDLPVWEAKFGNEYSTGTPLWTSERKSCDTKSKILLLPFVKR